MVDIDVILPSGTPIAGGNPIVIIGPNGSGKTRQSRTINAGAFPIEFVNALRNTRVNPDLPATGIDSARTNFTNQKAAARGQHWEMASEFDWMLSQLAAQQANAAVKFASRWKNEPSTDQGPEQTPMDQIERLWAEVFPGRTLDIVDWKPIVTNEATGSTVSYSGNQMSDGEKSALYLAGRVFTFEGGLLVVDEPETHFHSLLATKFWNALEEARPDIRFVYLTHDLTFAMSRLDPVFVLASPTRGLRVLALESDLPSDVATTLLGSASLSFYASRVVFCEGSEDGYDSALYNSWFRGQDTVVRPVRGYESVVRCVDALNQPGITMSLDAIGIIDRDYRSDALVGALPAPVQVLNVHEVESLLALPGVVSAVMEHLSKSFDESGYLAALRATVSSEQRRMIIVQRWKTAIEPLLEALVAKVTGRQHTTIDELAASMPDIFNMTTWSFDPANLLSDEEARVDGALAGDVSEFLRIVPGKQLLPVAAHEAGMAPKAYVAMIMEALRGSERLKELARALEAVLVPYLPARAVPAIQEASLDGSV